MEGAELREIFDRVKEALMADWKNFYFEQSYQQGLAMFETIMMTNLTEKSAQREVLQSFSYQDF